MGKVRVVAWFQQSTFSADESKDIVAIVAHKGLLEGIAAPVSQLVVSEGRLAKVGKA